MSIEVALRALSERWRALSWWVGGTLVFVVIVAALWPSMRDSREAQEAVADYPEVFKAMLGGEDAFDMAQGSGYLEVWMFSLVVPIVVAACAIGFAARTLAGEEENGQLELVLSYPVSRRAVVLEKALAILLAVLATGGLIVVALLMMDLIVDLEVGLGRLLATVIGVMLVSLFYGAVALLAGAAIGRQSFALAAGGLGLAVGYVLVVAGHLADDVSWVRYLSPLHYGVGTDPLTGSWPVASHAALLVLAVGAVGAAAALIDRRDVAT
jgi:ABC-2 type transport system permease protein